MIIHFDAGHDVNGNPRRAYVRFAETYGHGAIAQVWNEGYHGSAAVDPEYQDEAKNAPRVPTTFAFYRTLRRLSDLTKAGAA